MTFKICERRWIKCSNKETEEKGQLVYTIKLLCCIKSGVILRKFQWCIQLHTAKSKKVALEIGHQ